MIAVRRDRTPLRMLVHKGGTRSVSPPGSRAEPLTVACSSRQPSRVRSASPALSVRARLTAPASRGGSLEGCRPGGNAIAWAAPRFQPRVASPPRSSSPQPQTTLRLAAAAAAQMGVVQPIGSGQAAWAAVALPAMPVPGSREDAGTVPPKAAPQEPCEPTVFAPMRFDPVVEPVAIWAPAQEPAPAIAHERDRRRLSPGRDGSADRRRHSLDEGGGNACLVQTVESLLLAGAQIPSPSAASPSSPTRRSATSGFQWSHVAVGPDSLHAAEDEAVAKLSTRERTSDSGRGAEVKLDTCDIGGAEAASQKAAEESSSPSLGLEPLVRDTSSAIASAIAAAKVAVCQRIALVAEPATQCDAPERLYGRQCSPSDIAEERPRCATKEAVAEVGAVIAAAVSTVDGIVSRYALPTNASGNGEYCAEASEQSTSAELSPESRAHTTTSRAVALGTLAQEIEAISISIAKAREVEAENRKKQIAQLVGVEQNCEEHFQELYNLMLEADETRVAAIAVREAVAEIVAAPARVASPIGGEAPQARPWTDPSVRLCVWAHERGSGRLRRAGFQVDPATSGAVAMPGAGEVLASPLTGPPQRQPGRPCKTPPLHRTGAAADGDALAAVATVTQAPLAPPPPADVGGAVGERQARPARAQADACTVLSSPRETPLAREAPCLR